MDQHQTYISQWISNLLGGGAIVTSLMGILPGVASILAAVMAFVWYAIQAYESKTVQRWTSGRRVRKLARLKARLIMLEAQHKALLPGPDEGGAALVDRD